VAGRHLKSYPHFVGLLTSFFNVKINEHRRLMAKIKKKTEKRIKRKVSKPKTRKKKGVFGVKKIKKNPLVAKSIFNSEASKVNALFIDNPKHGVQHNPHPDSDLNEALKEFDVLQNSQTENNSAPAEGKESLDLNNQNDINNINNQTQQPKENKKRFSWRKLFSFKWVIE